MYFLHDFFSRPRCSSECDPDHSLDDEIVALNTLIGNEFAAVQTTGRGLISTIMAMENADER